MMGFGFAPRGWALCDGQLLSVSQHAALYSILGTRFGGNGRTNFGLPDLRQRIPLGQGQGPGLGPRRLGETGGGNRVSLTAEQMPLHRHTLKFAPGTRGSGQADSDEPKDNVFATQGGQAYAPDANGKFMADDALSTVGQGQAHENRQPYLTMNFCIALEGIFPPRP
ncbi:microcystin-dependent protein [Natronospira proteinivora]|uniref:Microcystin-dependent protein n=1 Tax=Natronospira proteinivora TaxID=1807133 RepID=A0ABT1GBE4_9GAMM|nr:tail fiber protein [Natronospira proteinivora]MCP1728645.1 microcystin-dependent protein [Natronospira proteinivora]